MKKGMTHSSGSQNLNGLQHRATPPVGFSVPPQPSSSKPRLSSMNEEEEMEDGFDKELSAEAQAHNISMFLSSSTSDSGEEHEPTVSSSTVITNVYRDPLAVCMDGIEEMARQILKTGKLTIAGEPGDMSKVQPAMFSLQASEKELGQLIPQLMQMPLFYQREPSQTNLMEDLDEDESFMTVLDQDEALANGNLRVAVPVDTAIYTLLRSHCAKGARQAEEAINTAMRDTYVPSHPGTFASMPPIVKFNSAPRRLSSISSQGSKNGSATQLTPNTIREELVSRKQISSSSISTDGSTTTSAKLSTQSSMSMHTSYGSLPGSSEASDSNIAHSEEVMNRSTSPYNADGVIPSHYTHRLLSRSASSDVTQRKGSLKDDSSESTLTPESAATKPSTPKHRAVDRTLSASRGRKTSTVEPPDLKPRARSRGDSMASETSQAADSALLVPGSRWNTSILENNTIVAQYGGIPYPIVWWEPSFKIDFRLSSSVGLLSGTVMGIDPLIPEVTLKVFNNSPRQVGFAIRSHRQSSIYSSHVVYPTKGLHVLEPHKMWEDNVEFITTNPGNAEMFVIDLFFCTLDEKPVWNVVRKYAIMKAQKSPGNHRRVSRRRQSYLQLPGSRDAKGDNLEVVLSHGLQCVVKGKLPEAEVIFSQALYLPDFQRVPLKAFVCICLAVVANKRMKEGTATTLVPVMVAVESASKLVSICEEGPGSPKMPYTIQLVKQLKKELNLQKLMKEFRRTGHQRLKHREDTVVEEFKDISPESGGELDHKQTIVTVPPGALTTPTSISLSLAGSRQLISMLKASGWSKIVQIATAIHIDCNPPVDHFKKPIQIKTKLPEGTKLGKSSLVRLMHSNYLRHWEDITDDVLSKISVSGEDVFIETNLPGWLAVSVIQFDASMIAQMVLKSISIEPIMLKLSVFGFIDAERKSIQMAIFAVPCKANEEPIHKDIDKFENFIPISFPHVVQAFPNEKLQLEIKGTFEPDVGLGDNSLTFKMDVHQNHNQIHTLWVRSTCTSDLPPSGKLSVSSSRDNSDKWENIASISLSMRTNMCGSSSPKESTSSGE